ncbi:MAG: prolipoprotein diacylglyceryl transferase [Oscillospiraceae bacterium]|nr:prolipoprotein diacylglyceryl transferase [Oscillospiraceae bacterium]
MSEIAVFTGDITVYWSSVIICLGIAAGLCMTLALYPMDHRHNTAVWVFFPLALSLSVPLSRLIHWYSHIESYPSLLSAVTDYSSGGYCVQGIILGVLLAALLVRLLRLTPSAGELLDAVSPGLALTLALIRLSSLFNTGCRGRIVISNPVFQRLPFAVSWTDAAGNVEFRLATFFLEFLALLIVTALLLVFWFRHREETLWEGCPNNGNVLCMFFLLVGIVEVIADSTRYDSALFHFFLIKRLNPYASFISIAQVFSAVLILLVFIRYMKTSVRVNGFSWYHVLAVVLFIASLVGTGYMGEYRVQRTARYVDCYLWQGSSLILLALTVFGIYRTCVAKMQAGERY